MLFAGAVWLSALLAAPAIQGRWESLPQNVPAVRQWFEGEQLVSPCEPAYGMSHLVERWKKYRHLPRVDVLGNYPSPSWFEGEIQFARNHIKWLDGQAAILECLIDDGVDVGLRELARLQLPLALFFGHEV